MYRIIVYEAKGVLVPPQSLERGHTSIVHPSHAILPLAIPLPTYLAISIKLASLKLT